MSYSIIDFIELLGALGFFIYGMKVMSEGIQKLAGSRMRQILEAMTSNRFKGVFTGFLITALVQSSSATTVMVVSFVNAGLLSLIESIGVIMGANIGTTVTAWIISLIGFKVHISAYALPIIAIGAPMLFASKSRPKATGETLIGFALLFMGAAAIPLVSSAQTQPQGSGTIQATAQTEQTIPFSAQATDLFGGENSYTLESVLNQPFSFGPFNLEPITGIEDQFHPNEGANTMINPAADFNGYVAVGDKQVQAKVYDQIGREVSTPDITVQEGIAHLYDNMDNLKDGMYLVVVRGADNFSNTFKFVKNESGFSGSKEIDSNIMDALGDWSTTTTTSSSSSTNGRLAGVPNYTISWDKGFGVIAGSEDVEILEGNNNNINLTVDLLPQAYFTINGTLDNKATGRAVLSINGADVDSVDFTNSTFSLTNILSDYDANNDVNDIQANVTIKSLDESYENKTLPVNLTDDLPGENVYNLGPINVTPYYTNATFKLRDNDTQRTIENIIATYDGVSTPVDSVFSLTNVPVDQYTVNFSTSDSTWILFNNFSQDFNLVKGNNEFIIDVDGSDKTFSGTLDIDVDDTEGRTLENMTAIIDGNVFTLGADGVLTQQQFSLPADPSKPWLSGTKDIPVIIQQSDSSYQTTTAFESIITIQEGANTKKINMTTVPFNFQGTYQLTVNDSQGRTPENMTAIIDGETIVLPANGQASKTFSLQQQTTKFWLPQDKDISVIVQQSDSSYQVPTPLSYTYSVQEGTNSDITTVTTIPFDWHADIPYVITDNATSNPIQGATISAGGIAISTNVNGQATLSIPLSAGTNFWQPETDKNITFDIIKTGYQDFPAENLTVNEGTNPTVSRTLEEIIVTGSGDIAINPYLNGNPKDNTTITMKNSAVPDSTYTINTGAAYNAVFYDIYVQNAGPVQYELTIESNDGTFLTTVQNIDIYQDENGEVNGSQIYNVNEIPNVQDISAYVYNTDLSKEQSMTVELVRKSDETVMDTQVSDVNGKVFFNDVPGETEVYLRDSKSGFFTLSFGSYATPLVDHVSEMDTVLNITAVQKFNYWDATPVTADTIQMYKPTAQNTEFLLNHWRISFPSITGGNQVYKDHFSEVATTLGFSGAIIPSDTPFSDPTTEQIDGYDPYPENRQVYTGQIGTNISSYSGTATTPGEKTLQNGNKVYFYAAQFNLGGLDWAATDHEIGWMLGFPALSGNTTTFKTSRNTSGTNYAIADSKHDSAIMSLWLKLEKLHYDTTDAQGRLIEYSLPEKFE